MDMPDSPQTTGEHAHQALSKWQLRMGANRQKSEEIEFRVWAPKAKHLSLSIVSEGKKTQYVMHPKDHGFFEVVLDKLFNPVDYFYCMEGEKLRPDPVSRWQPFGVNGPSRVYSPETFVWNDHKWKGISRNEYVIYELHVGTFTSLGTFGAIIEKLPYLQELGITAVELMPVIEFPGQRNWGYDGVYPYAPHHDYGGPEGLKRLIDASHQAGLAVILDVVYNHLGPEGNYLGDFGFYFTDRYKTPWGQAINFDGPYSDYVRQYFIDNALYWLTEYHADALRLDAIHAIFDFSAHSILEEIRAAFYRQAERLGRQAFIIAESDLNDVRIVNPIEKGGYAVDAQWNDDFHHSVHALLTKSRHSYFLDFGQLSQLAKSMTEGFVYDGQWSQYRKRKFGSSSAEIPGNQFVVCIQNHDQIGNACQGKRLGSLVSLEQYRLASTLLFCTPNLPLLFMGQEWNATTPFLYFTSYEDQNLAEKVREGYQREFLLEDAAIFDPQNLQRFSHSKLQWAQLKETDHAAMFCFYQRLIQLHKELPCLSNHRKDLTQACFSEEEQWLILVRGDSSGSQAILTANFKEETQTFLVFFPSARWTLRLSSFTGEAFSSFDLPSEFHIIQPTKRFVTLQAYEALLWSCT
jgi:maltooligosyltrehalose trehalohydrolase